MSLYHKGHLTWKSQGSCAPSRYCVLVLWSRARNSQEHQLFVSHCRCGHPSPTNASMRHSQCTLLSSTRPGTHFTDGWAGVLVIFFLLLCDSNQCPLGYINTRLYRLNHQGTHTHTHKTCRFTIANECTDGAYASVEFQADQCNLIDNRYSEEAVPVAIS